MTPSPASVELEPQESNRPSNAISETSSSATPLQNSGTDSTLSTINNDTMTLRSPAQGSLETSAMDTVEVSALSPSLLSPLNGQIRNKVRPDLQSMDREKDKKGKRVQQMLKNQVYKQSARFNTISKKIGHGVARGSMTLQRSNSAPGTILFLFLPTKFNHTIIRFPCSLDSRRSIPGVVYTFPEAHILQF